MKKAVLTTSIACFIVLFLVIGCSKNSTSSTPSTADETALQTTVTQNASDQNNIQTDDDAIANDATAATETVPGFGINAASNNLKITTFGATDSSSVPGIKIDTSFVRLRIPRIVLLYRGIADISGIIKKGKITVELIKGKRWTDTGAILKETDSVTITRNGNTRIYDGVRYVTNVSGGSYYKGPTNPFVYTMHKSGTVTFENGTVRSFWVARKNTFNKQTLTFTSDGDTTVNGSLCSIGGITRFGNPFLVQSPQTYVSNYGCGFDRPTAGIRVHISNGQLVTVTFGVDTAGTQTTSGCAYGYKVNWTKLSGQKGTAVISY